MFEEQILTWRKDSYGAHYISGMEWSIIFLMREDDMLENKFMSSLYFDIFNLFVYLTLESN